MLRRTGGEKRRRRAETGGRIRYDDALRADAAAHLDSVRSQDAP
jgi:hypothetical protein